MKPLNQRYQDYCNEHKAKVDKELAAAGLPPIGENALRYLVTGKDLSPATFEEYANGVDNALIPFAVAGIKHSEEQSKRAKKSRSKQITDDGKTASQIIGWLATSPGFKDDSAEDLWNHFYSELDQQCTNPREIAHLSGNKRKSAIEYDCNDKRKPMTFGQFSKLVSAFRTGKKLP